MLTGETRLIALIGDPVSHSLSPRMQNAAFAARGLDWAYVALAVGESALAAAVSGLVALGFRGANVTAPHKQTVGALCDEVDAFARRARSVNTLVIREGRVIGSTTDTEALADVESRRAVVVGAGGAARAFAAALAERGTDVRVFSRGGHWPPETAGADLVVHATPVRDEVLVELRPGQRVVDLAYRSDGRPTALVEAARAAGCERVVDGLEVLARQGAASFERWTGVRAPLEVMRASLTFGA
ncbi:MAG: shikimate dehydrogenase [Actinomycetota bacterium]|nr:shikimate dehydrogenase [Actinomycetota bacterium]